MTFTPPKPWTPDRIRAVITSLEDKTIIDQEAIPWCTTHNAKGIRPDLVCDLAQFAEFPVTDCNISMGGPDHKWWKDI